MNDAETTVWFSRHKADVSVYVRIENETHIADNTVKLTREERDKLLEILLEAREFDEVEEDA
jgi:hypothetical protein